MPDERMKYPSMEKMSAAFKAAHQQINESMDAMKKVSKMMEDGALQGVGGQAMVGAINGPLLKTMTMLADKMAELEKDINGAVAANRDGVSTAQSRFK